MYKRTFFSLLFILAFMQATASTVFADGDTACQPIYGGGQTCVQIANITINKKVLNPDTNTFVDNLGVNDPKYTPSSNITFQINVGNTGNQTSKKIVIKDIFPKYVSFVSSDGTFDTKSKTLTLEIPSVNAGETKTFGITGRVAPIEQLPGDQGVTCVINQATATVDGKTGQDNAQFCIQKNAPEATVPGTTKGGLKVFPQPNLTSNPSTGPEMLPLMGLLPTGIAGFFLRKKTGK